MAAAIAQNVDIDNVKLTITLKDLDNFDDTCSNIFYVRGIPWVIQFEKVGPRASNANQSSLGVYLSCERYFKRKTHSIVANFEAEIISSKFNEESHEYIGQPCAFDANKSVWGNDYVISWAELMDPEKGYVRNNTCKIIVSVKASPFIAENKNEMLKFEPIRKCCDGSWIGTFRLTTNRVHDFFDVCTPIFTLNDFQWRILISKEKRMLPRTDFLRIHLTNLSIEKDASCKAKFLCKLLSCDPNDVEPLQNQYRIKKFDCLSSSDEMGIISWNELMNPQQKFIENESFVLEIEIEVSEANGQKATAVKEIKAVPTKGKCKECGGAPKMTCPICFELLNSFRPIAVTLCGHLFCLCCVLMSLRRRPYCPSCNRRIDRTHLRRVFLP